MELIVRREIAASRERVWSVVTDLERFPTVLSGVDGVERVDGGEEFGVGTRWRETRTLFGRQATEEMRVAEVDPGRGYETIADSRGTTYLAAVRLEPLGEDRCRLSMTFSARPSTALGRLVNATVGRVFQGPARRMLQQDLVDIATAAEAHEA